MSIITHPPLVSASLVSAIAVVVFFAAGVVTVFLVLYMWWRRSEKEQEEGGRQTIFTGRQAIFTGRQAIFTKFIGPAIIIPFLFPQTHQLLSNSSKIATAEV